MNLTTRGKIFFLIAFLSFAFSLLITTFDFFPHLGISLTLLTFTLISYHFKSVKTARTKTYLLFTIFFALLIFVRSNPLITFLNIIATLFFGSLMLTSTKKDLLGFVSHFLSPIVLMFKTFFTQSQYFPEYNKGHNNTGTKDYSNYLFGILVSTILLIIVIPLLSSANPLFNKMTSDFLSFFDLGNVFKNIAAETIIVWCIRIVFFMIFLIAITKVLTLVKKNENFEFPISFSLKTYSLIIPKFVLTVVLLIFFIAQYQFYFANETLLAELQLSYSQHAREVFAQLSVVAAIVILLLYNDPKTSKFSNILNWVLGTQGIFLTLMAYKSAFEYIGAWGLTYVRLYGIAFATLISGVFILYFYNLQIGKNPNRFVSNTIFLSGVILLLINILNFDYLIFHFGKSTTGQGVDYTYLSRLSPDSISYKDQYLKLVEETEKTKYITLEYDNKDPLYILYQVEALQQKYSKPDIRTFSLLDYLQYTQIRNIDTKGLREGYEKYFIYQ